MSGRYQLVDLMSDVARFSYDDAAARVVHIVKTSSGYRVIESGRMADGLAFDEMLGQVVNLLHPKLGNGHYTMMTRDELIAEERRHRARTEAPDRADAAKESA